MAPTKPKSSDKPSKREEKQISATVVPSKTPALVPKAAANKALKPGAQGQKSFENQTSKVNTINKPIRNVAPKQQPKDKKKTAALKEAEISRAKHVQKKAIEGSNGTRVREIHTSGHFHRPKTFRPPRNPKYPKISVPTSCMDVFNIIKYPMTTEAAMKNIEDNNTVVFLVPTKATKNHIRQSVEKLFDINVSRVKTVIRPDGKKKAYVRLAKDYDALDVANKMGII